jgi:hypothetical protein
MTAGQQALRKKSLDDPAVILIPFCGSRRRCDVECDSKDSPAEQSGASSAAEVNFPLTNQRADSFSSPGVNLEAKV